MDNKYLFRVYKFDDKGNIISPFLAEEGQEFGKTSTAEDYTEDRSNEFGDLFHKGDVYKTTDTHHGFSTIGKIDPRYSTFDVNEAADFYDEDFEDQVHTYLHSLVPESAIGQTQFKGYYADDEEDDYDFLMNSIYSIPERVNAIAKARGQDASNIMSMSLSPQFIDFEGDNVWDDLVEDIDIYDLHGQKYEGNKKEDGNEKIVLVSSPESKMLTIDDMIAQGLTTQRDFPSEIVTTQVTPIKELTGYPEARKKYRSLRKMGAGGKEAFGESFKLEPGQIGSDKNIKHVLNDLSNCYKKHTSSKSIISGIKELGQ